MKTTKILTLVSILSLFLSGCIVNQQPVYPPVKACFATTYDTYQVDEIIYFNNCSENVVSYHWDFGDGGYSNIAYPSYSYAEQGTYQVTLTAYGQDTRSEYSMNIVVNSTTDLDILVKYYGTTDVVSNCDVTLYDTEQNWIDLVNPIISGTTDSYGSIIFVDVAPIIYYIDAYKYVDDYNYYCNELLGYATDPLVEDAVNYYDIYVELLASTAKSARNDRKNFVIKKIVKTNGNDIYRKNIRKKNKIILKK